MRKLLGMVMPAMVTAAMALVAPGVAQASPYCGIRWGSLPKSVNDGPVPESSIADVRAGRHACFDRLVLDVDNAPGSYDVRYVSTVTRQGSGTVLPLRGAISLRIDVGSVTYDVHTGAATYRPADPTELVDVHGWRTFRQVAMAGSFEGTTRIGLGVRARLPFRVFTLDNPDRVVIDVAHRW